jgi:NADPH:quinone reductase
VARLNRYPLRSPYRYLSCAVGLTTYDSAVKDFKAMPMQAPIGQIVAGEMQVHIARVFRLDEIVEAHRLMKSNADGGKIVELP